MSIKTGSGLFCVGCGSAETFQQPILWDRLASEPRCEDCLTQKATINGHTLTLDGQRFVCEDCGRESQTEIRFWIRSCDARTEVNA